MQRERRKRIRFSFLFLSSFDIFCLIDHHEEEEFLRRKITERREKNKTTWACELLENTQSEQKKEQKMTKIRELIVLFAFFVSMEKFEERNKHAHTNRYEYKQNICMNIITQREKTREIERKSIAYLIAARHE